MTNTILTGFIQDIDMQNFIANYVGTIIKSEQMLEVEKGYYVYPDLLFKALFDKFNHGFKHHCELVVITVGSEIKPKNIYDYIFHVAKEPTNYDYYFGDPLNVKMQSVSPLELWKIDRGEMGMFSSIPKDNHIFVGVSFDPLKRNLTGQKSGKIVFPPRKPFEKNESERPLFRYSLN